MPRRLQGVTFSAISIEVGLQMSQRYPSKRSAIVLSGFQLVAAVVMFPAFFTVVSFLAATSASTAQTLGHPLPAGWTAGVMTHGSYYQWWLIEDRPMMFSLATVTFTACFAFLLWSIIARHRHSKATVTIASTA